MRQPQITCLEIPGCLLLRQQVHSEERGSIYSLYNETYKELDVNFVEDKISQSKKGVLRGLHGDFSTTKLVMCLHGYVDLVLLDCRYNSTMFGKAIKMSIGLGGGGDYKEQILIPPGVFNAHYCPAPRCLFWYKLDKPYSGSESQIAVRWNSDNLKNIWGVIESPILSERDQNAPDFKDINWRKYKRTRTVAVSGHFNPLHSGHLDMLKAAAEISKSYNTTFSTHIKGSSLVVIVNNDSQVSLKKDKPFMNQDERLYIMSSLAMVDKVVLSIDEDRTVNKTLELLSPDFFCNGGDVTLDNCKERETCERLGIEMVFGVGGVKTQSSSWLLDKIK